MAFAKIELDLSSLGMLKKTNFKEITITVTSYTTFPLNSSKKNP